MKEPIRILQVFTIMNRGGAETMIMNYYRNIDRSKVQFDFLVHRKERGAYDDEIESMGGKIYRLDPINYLKLKSYKNKLDHFFKENNYKIVHSHLNATSSIILEVAKNNNVPVRIAHSHTNLSGINLLSVIKGKKSWGNFFKKTIKDYLKKNITNNANYSFACEGKAGIWLFGNKKFEIINNAIDANKFKYDKKASITNKKKIGVFEKKVYGHIGNFSEAKNYPFLINIFKEILNREKDSILLLIGRGKNYDFIKQQVVKMRLQDNIIFMGIQKDIPYFLQALDVFIFPSIYEGLPVTLIEAQATGLKCFVSDVVDKKVDITGLIDFISLKKNAKQWAEHILKNKEYIRTNTYDKIVANGYDIKENAKQLENFYLSIL